MIELAELKARHALIQHGNCLMCGHGPHGVRKCLGRDFWGDLCDCERFQKRTSWPSRIDRDWSVRRAAVMA